MLQRSMDYLWTKQSCILDNIANQVFSTDIICCHNIINSRRRTNS